MSTLVTAKDREEELVEATRPTTPEEIKRYVQKNKIQVVDFKDKNSLQGAGNTLFKQADPANNKPISSAKYNVVQNSLEGSNANAIETMISSMNGMRVYDSLTNIIKTTNGTLNKTINEVGRVKR